MSTTSRNQKSVVEPIASHITDRTTAAHIDNCTTHRQLNCVEVHVLRISSTQRYKIVYIFFTLTLNHKVLQALDILQLGKMQSHLQTKW